MRATKYQHPETPTPSPAFARAARNKARKAEALHQKLEAIAREECGVATLTPRNMDSLDFHDIGVISLKAALKRAYEAGQRGQ